MLPVSHYEALLAEVRGLRRKAQRVQELATPLISSGIGGAPSTSGYSCQKNVETLAARSYGPYGLLDYAMDHPFASPRRNSSSLTDYEVNSSAEGETTCSEEDYGVVRSNSSVNSEPICHYNRSEVPAVYQNTWPVERNMWNSEPTKSDSPDFHATRHVDTTSVMSFACSSGGAPLDRVLGSPNMSRRSSTNQLEAKVDMVYSLLAMLGGQEHADMGETLLALSTSPESCLAMRQSGCIPLLVQLVQSDKDCETRNKASQALQNLINAQPDEKIRKREVRIFKLLEQAREYTEALRTNCVYQPEVPSEDGDIHPVQTVAHLMKLSFDEGHRYAICQLGGINIIASLIEMEHAKHGSLNNEFHCVLLRRYACMTLTNLTFGDSGNKALLCSCREFMRALVVQLQSPSDELRQVTASVLRNLSWRADSTSKEILREVGTVTGLMKAAMINNKENTLKSILSALWNLSAHSTENKAEICAIDGALGFLVDTLTYKTPSKTLAIAENAGGILRNVSSQVAVRDDYREVLRKHGCLRVLLDQLKSPSLTVVSNACGTLWNLSAKNTVDQEALWEMGAPAMLRSLNHSRHKMIAMGSSAALKNLLSSRPRHDLSAPLDSTARAMDLPALPTLGARRQKAILQDLDQGLAETFDNIDRDSPGAEERRSTRRAWRSDSQQLTSREDVVCEARCTRSDSYLTFGGGCEASTSQDDEERWCFKKRNKSSTQKCYSDETEDQKNTSLPFEDDAYSFCSKSSGYQTSTPLSSDFNDTHISRNGSKRNVSSVLNISIDQNVQIDNEMFKTRQKSSQSDEKDHCSIEDASDSDDRQKYGDSLLKEGESNHIEEYSEITASFKDLDTLEMGNAHGKDGKLFMKSRKKNKKGKAENADHLVNSTPNEDGLIRRTVEILDVDNDASNVSRASDKFISHALQEKTVEEVTGETQDSSVSSTNKEEPPPVPTPPSEETPSQNREPQITQELEDNCLEMGPELVETSIDNRMLDPDAMIESLDRFTAELVSQASHLQNKDEIKYTASVTEGSTWNEDTSPNDVTFPSISGSAPNVITFESEETNGTSEEAPQVEIDVVDAPAKGVSNDFSSVNTSTLTDSTLIAMEATKIIDAFKTEDSSIIPRKGSTSLMKRAVTNSYNQASSLENLDLVNPPSTMGELLDMEGSMASVASLASEIAEATKSEPNPIFTVKQPLLLHMNSVTEIDMINPPSLLNEVSDIYNSLNDVNTEIINGDTTEVFEDCRTHLTDATLQITDDYSDANVTPLQSDFSSADSTPKRSKPINKHLTPKQRRNLARERYKTYTVAAEMVTQKSQDDSDETSPDYKTCEANTFEGVPAGKVTPKERRRQDRSRFETQVIDAPLGDSDVKEDTAGNSRRQTDRFKTRTLNENELQNLVQEEANLVLKTLKETKSLTEDLLECETLSLVSNDDDSENNSGSSVNYRTYHKSWGVKPNIPVIHPLATDPLNCQPSNFSGDEIEEPKAPAKPKIVKPDEKPPEPVEEREEEQPKGIRGRRKPLYSKTVTKTTGKTLNSDLVKNVTSNVKTSTAMKPSIARPKTAVARIPQKTVAGTSTKIGTAAPQTARSRLPAAKTSTRPKPASAPPPLERQGTFTKDEPSVQPPKSRIPTAAKPPQSKIARPLSQTNRVGVKSASSDRSAKAQSSPSRLYNRSPSLDAKKPNQTSAVGQGAASGQAAAFGQASNLAQSKSSSQRSSSSSSISGGGGDTAAKKQITSKIASLWKKIEQNKKQQPAKQDGRVWISPSTV